MNGALEGFVWLLLMAGFIGIAGVCTVGTAIFGFICRNKFLLIITAILGWVGYHMVKNSKKNPPGRVFKETMRTVSKPISKYKLN